MNNSTHKWVTVKYKEDAFDVHLSNDADFIKEIRPIDSEFNIVPMMSKETIQYFKEKIFMKERIMQYKDLRQINVSQHIEKKNGLSYLSWSWALDQ